MSKKINKSKQLSLNEEIVLSCAFRYALGRATYVVGVICEELQKNYHLLPISTKERISREIQEYQDEYGEAVWNFDNDQWNRIKWLFDTKRKVTLEANYYNTEKWEEFEAIEGEDGKYYSIPNMNEYHTVRNIKKSINDGKEI